MVSSTLRHIIGSIVSASSAIYAMLLAHGSFLALAVSLLAGLYTFLAAKATRKLRKAELELVEMQKKEYEVKIHYKGPHRPIRNHWSDE